jgi:multiple sugar transport system substrate-binding protein
VKGSLRARAARRILPGLLLAAELACGCSRGDSAGPTVLRFWAMGREGEVVQELVTDFERLHPDIHVVVQQIPWSAAHEKLLTAHVGRSTPDLSQLGNTWIAEFAALRAIEPLNSRLRNSSAIRESGYFPGIWDTNILGRTVYGLPWYVDTRLLFYRKDILARAGYPSMPQSWGEWRTAMEAVKRVVGKDHYAIFLPVNEPTQAVIFGLQAGSTLLEDEDTRGGFEGAPFRKAFDFYLGLFRDHLAPAVGNNDIANLYQEFERGTFAMYITGPWNLGEFRSRLPDSLQGAWSTAALPGPTGAASGVSLAGGSSLVLFRDCKHKEAAWKLMEYLSEPAQQLRFYHLTGDLPARRECWSDTALSADERIRAFGVQLGRVAPSPKIPEWEEIIARVQDKADLAIRGGLSADSALAGLDREVARILEKRRWLVERGRLHVGERELP